MRVAVVEKTIERLTRMTSSSLGNPRYRVWFTDGTSYPTQPNSMWALGAENAEYRGGPVKVHIERGQVTYVEERSKA